MQQPAANLGCAMYEYRDAQHDELDSLKSFLFDHGTNPWNYLPQQGIDRTFEMITKNQAEALIVRHQRSPIGLAIFFYADYFPINLIPYVQPANTLYIAEVVVHGQYAGQGIGSTLLAQIINRGRSLGARKIIIDRHEENKASAAMMHKVGFKEVCTFADLERRDYGSQNTTILEIELSNTTQSG